MHPGPSFVPLALVRTRMINPVVVKQIPHPTQPQPLRPQHQPIPVSHPYTCTDVFDSLMNSSKGMQGHTA